MPTKSKTVQTKFVVASLGVLLIGGLAGCGSTTNSVSPKSTGNDESTLSESETSPGMTQVYYPGMPDKLTGLAINDGTLSISQGTSNGTVFQWDQNALPTKPQSTVAQIQPINKWTPEMPASVSMGQINFDNNKKSLLMGKKSMNINVTGGNSIWEYTFGGAGQVRAGNITPAGNGAHSWAANAKAANEYTSSNFPVSSAKELQTVSIGDGAGVLQAKNNWYYFSSLQSGCVYKADLQWDFAAAVYCIPNWGANNQNQSVYSLAEDAEGNVYAVYQGSVDNNTIVLKIDPNGKKDDTVQAMQVTGYARTMGLAVNSDASKVWVTGVSMDNYSKINANAIVTVTNPQWGSVEKPTANKSEAVTVDPPHWLTRLAYDEKRNVLYAGDSTGGYWIDFLGKS